MLSPIHKLMTKKYYFFLQKSYLVNYKSSQKVLKYNKERLKNNILR